MKAKRSVAILLVLGLFPAVVRADTNALYSAVRAQDAVEVKALIAAGADVGVLIDSGDGALLSPLFWAVRNNDAAVARLLIAGGALDHEYAVFDGPTGTYRTALGDAAIGGSFAVAEVMLEHGAHIDGASRAEYDSALDRYVENAIFNSDQTRLLAWADHIPVDWTPHLALLLQYRAAEPATRAIIEQRFPGVLYGTVNELNVILALPERGLVYRDHPEVQFPLASSYLDDPRVPGRYSVDKAFDGDLATAWVEGVDGPGGGERSAFLIPDGARAIEIYAGYGEERYYSAKNRLKRATLRIHLLQRCSTEMAFNYRLKDVHAMELRFVDEPRFQSFALDAVELPRVAIDTRCPEWLFAVLEIAEVYPGTRWDDTCIAEIRFVR